MRGGLVMKKGPQAGMCPWGCAVLGERGWEQEPSLPSLALLALGLAPPCAASHALQGGFFVCFFFFLKWAQLLRAFLYFTTDCIDLGVPAGAEGAWELAGAWAAIKSIAAPSAKPRGALGCREPRHSGQIPGGVPSLCQGPGSLWLQHAVVGSFAGCIACGVT